MDNNYQTNPQPQQPQQPQQYNNYMYQSQRTSFLSPLTL